MQIIFTLVIPLNYFSVLNSIFLLKISGLTSLMYLENFFTLKTSRVQLHHIIFRKYKDTEVGVISF